MAEKRFNVPCQDCDKILTTNAEIMMHPVMGGRRCPECYKAAYPMLKEKTKKLEEETRSRPELD